ncbi:MAG: electron transfer flavoprotein subunit alpha/FixB family protein, partial [Shewanella sp.]
MAILVLAEHDNSALKQDTAKVVSAACAIGGDVHVLVVGHQCGAVAQAAQALQGVGQVLHADHSVYQAHLAENVAKLLVELAPNYSHILAAASSVGKDTLPRVA